MPEDQKAAVRVRNAWKRYSPKTVILKSLNMTVESGTIYGLLGPSGCGKTTLLSCIVGSRILDSGTIYLAATEKIQVGFMPQDITLNTEFTVMEVFNFYGLLYGLTETKIALRGAELINLLEIPNDGRYIGKCSGGQQRRISMAVTFLHDPEILILDEPTVGVDPVLCANIWEYFVKIVRIYKKTIIITTHYIEEAKNANRIGLMRGGILLAEEPPMALLERYNADSLEEAFLQLSAKQEIEGEPVQLVYPPMNPNTPPLQNKKKFEFNRFKAQMIKNINWTKRNIPVTAFVICLPAILMNILGHLNDQRDGDLPVSHRPLAIVNDETDSCTENKTKYLQLLDNCQPTEPFSCRYIDNLQTVFKTESYPTVEAGIQGVKRSRAFGVIYFEANYSQNMMLRIVKQNSAPGSALDGSEAKAWLDMSEFAYAIRTVFELSYLLVDTLQDIIVECGYERKIASLPVHIEEKLFAPSDLMHTYVSPYFGSIAFYTSAVYSSSSIVMERSSGLFERSKVAGLTMFEIVVAHIVIQVIVMALLNTLSFFVIYGVLDNPMVGSLGLSCSLLSFNELCGMVFGFFLAVIIRIERNVAYAGVAIVLTLFMTTGIIWPVEGQHWLLRPLSAMIPVTYSSKAYSMVTVRGFDITKIDVLKGFLAPSVAIVFLITVSLLAVKYKLVGSID